jgi:hypothetical protein
MNEPEPDLSFMRLYFVIPDGWREVFKGKARLNDRYPSPGRACYYWLTICAERHIGRNVRDFVCVIRKVECKSPNRTAQA